MKLEALRQPPDGIELSGEEIEALVFDALIRAGAGAEPAEEVARLATFAELSGCLEGGLAAILAAIELLRTGRVLASAAPHLRDRDGPWMEVDGGHGFAAPAFTAGLAPLIAASRAGMARLGLVNIADPGSVAPFAMRIAAEGRVAVVDGPDGRIAVARPGPHGRPVLDEARDLMARVLVNAPWRPEGCPWDGTGPVGGPVTGRMLLVALPPQGHAARAHAQSRLPDRAGAVVSAALIARIANG